MRPFAFEFRGEPARAELTYLHDGALTLTVGNVSGALAFAATDKGIDIHFAGQRLLASVYTAGESDHVFSPRGATQILSIDLLAHAGLGQADTGPRRLRRQVRARRFARELAPVRHRPPHCAHAGQGDLVRGEGR